MAAAAVGQQAPVSHWLALLSVRLECALLQFGLGGLRLQSAVWLLQSVTVIDVFLPRHFHGNCPGLGLISSKQQCVRMEMEEKNPDPKYGKNSLFYGFLFDLSFFFL